ncbi:MAG: hypothetical protein EZS28_024702, partial [Streblomastix strix]
MVCVNEMCANEEIRP